MQVASAFHFLQREQWHPRGEEYSTYVANFFLEYRAGNYDEGCTSKDSKPSDLRLRLTTTMHMGEIRNKKRGEEKKERATNKQSIGQGGRRGGGGKENSTSTIDEVYSLYILTDETYSIPIIYVAMLSSLSSPVLMCDSTPDATVLALTGEVGEPV